MKEPWELDWGAKPPSASTPPSTSTQKEPWELDWGAPPKEAEAPQRGGVQQIGRDIMGAGQIIYDEFGRVNRKLGGVMEQLQRGELRGVPEAVLPEVATAIMPAARGTAAAIASVAGRRGAAAPAAAAQAPKYPPVPEGHVRFYHGSDGPTPRSGWVTPYYEYARDYNRIGSGPSNVSYIDLPKGHPQEIAARAWDEIDAAQIGNNMVGRYTAHELPGDVAAGLKPYVTVGGSAPLEGFPKYAQTERGMQVAEQLADKPYVGTPIREAAQKTLGEFEGRVAAADASKLNLYGRAEAISDAAKPTRAGNRLREAAKDEIYFMPGVTQAERAANLAPGVERLRSGRTETAVKDLIDLAEKDPKALASLRKSVLPQDWSGVQGAAFQELGLTRAYSHGATSATFEPLAALEKYEAMSPAGRNVLFGGSKTPFRANLDSLAADMKTMKALEEKLVAESSKYDVLRRIPTESSAMGKLQMAGVVGGGLVHPLAALAAVVGGRVTASMMSRPVTSAALAQWSKAYVRFFQSGGAPGGLAALRVATHNLRSASGVDIDPDKLIEAMRGGAQGPTAQGPTVQASAPQQASAKQSRDTGDPMVNALLDSMEQGPHAISFTTKMAPKGIPWESWRQMDPSLIEQRPEPSMEERRLLEEFASVPQEERLNINKFRPRNQREAELIGMMRASEANRQLDMPRRGPLSDAAGLADLESMQRRPPFNKGNRR